VPLHDPALAKQKLGDILDPDSPDLHGSRIAVARSSFITAGRMTWCRRRSPLIITLRWRRRWGPERVESFYRLFMVPGMSHCGGGLGANVLFHSEEAAAVPLEPNRDALTALEQWVEQGRAPSTLHSLAIG
jgi:hypothetical protein